MKVKIGKEHTTIRVTNRQAITLLEHLRDLSLLYKGDNDLTNFVSDLEEAYKNPVDKLSGKKPYARPHWNK